MNQLVPRASTPPSRPPPRPLRARRVTPSAHKRGNVRVWVPITPLAIVLSPIALIASPFIAIAAARHGINPVTLMVNMTRIVLSLGGTEVKVRGRKSNVYVKIF